MCHLYPESCLARKNETLSRCKRSPYLYSQSFFPQQWITDYFLSPGLLQFFHIYDLVFSQCVCVMYNSIRNVFYFLNSSASLSIFWFVIIFFLWSLSDFEMAILKLHNIFTKIDWKLVRLRSIKTWNTIHWLTHILTFSLVALHTASWTEPHRVEADPHWSRVHTQSLRCLHTKGRIGPSEMRPNWMGWMGGVFFTTDSVADFWREKYAQSKFSQLPAVFSVMES